MFFRRRQEKFPEEFRIEAFDWDYQCIFDLINNQKREIHELQNKSSAYYKYGDNLENEVEELKKQVEELEQQIKIAQILDMDSIKDVILRIWRVNNRANYYKSNNNTKRIEKMVKDNDDFDDAEIDYIVKNVKDSIKPVKYVEKQSKALLKVFKENGFEIKDHTNSKYYDGMALNVLVFETDDNLEESTITETIKPSIFYNGELILNGEVVVSSPSKNN